MKKLIIAFILSVSFTGNAQDLKNWQVGVNLNPFVFSRINSSFLFEKDKQNFPNGFAYGITIEKNWNEHWGFKTGFESTKQNEKYFFNEVGADNIRIKSSFKYYKVPISIQYSYFLKEKIFLTFNQGIQFSYLKYYKTVEAGSFEIRTLTSDYDEYISFQHPESNSLTYGDFEETFHKKYLLGIIGSIGLKGFISRKISYSTNLRYEYDITYADNLPYYSLTPGNTDSEKPTHNFRLGLELGLQYHFSLAGCGYCKNQKH